MMQKNNNNNNNMILSTFEGVLVGWTPDRKRKSALCITYKFFITDDNSDSLYSLNGIILDFPSRVFVLVLVGKSLPGPDINPR